MADSPVGGQNAGPPTDLVIRAHVRTHEKVSAILGEFPDSARVKVLDLGAGPGAFSLRLKRMGFDVEAADIFPENFEVPDVKCHRVHADRPFSLPDETYDVVVSIEVIEHLQDQFNYAREINRILKPGGRLILTTPNIINMASRLRYFLTGFYSLVVKPINEFKGTKLHDHIGPLTYYQVRYILHTSGLRIRRVTTDRYRRSNFGLLPLWPFMKYFTWITMQKETDPRQREVNREIYRNMTGLDLQMGRTLIIEAEKVGPPESAQGSDGDFASDTSKDI